MAPANSWNFILAQQNRSTFLLVVYEHAVRFSTGAEGDFLNAKILCTARAYRH